MSVSSSTSKVTITLNLAGQAATVKGITTVTGAISDMTDAITEANEQLSTSAEAAATKVQASADTIGEAADAAGADWNAAADEITAAAARMAEAAETAAGASEDMATRNTAAATTSSTSVMSLLTSFKTLALGASVYMGVKAYSGYTSGLVKLSTLAGLTQQQVKSLNKEIMNTAVALRQSPSSLAQGAYSPASERFGLKGTENVLARASQLANIGGNPLSGPDGTSYALSTMLQTLGLKPTASNVARVAAMIRGTTSAGDMQLSDLTNAMSTGVLNIGKTYGINPEASLGALAYFTSQGVPAQEAATRMRMTESLLVGQTSQASKYGELIGITPDQIQGSESALSQQLFGLGLRPTQLANVVRQGPGGLANAFNLLNKSMAGLPPDQQEALWAKLFGGGRTDATAMTLAQGAMSGKLMGFTNAVVGDSTVGGLNTADAQWNASPTGQLKAFDTELQVVATEIGSVVTPALESLMNVLGPLLNLFAQHKILLDALAILIGGELAFKLLGLVKNLKMVSSAISMIRDAKAFEGIISGATTAESAVGKLIQKLLGVSGAAKGAAGTAAKTGAGDAAGDVAAGTGVGLGATAGLVAAAVIIPLAATAGALELAHLTGQYNNMLAKKMAASVTEKNILKAQQAFSHQNVGGPTGGHFAMVNGRWMYVGAGGDETMSPTPKGYAAGGITDGPVAIAGEGNPAYPEYVIPTDPAYRARAVALFQSLGGELVPGSMTPSAVQSLPGAERTLANTIGTVVPGGLFRQMLLNLVGSVFSIAAGTGGGSGGGGSSILNAITGGGGSASQNLTLGQRMAAALGWTGLEWTDLQQLWQRESGWNQYAKNPKSGAYGIAQALPASKYPLAGQAAGGSSPNAQIQWGLNYIRSRYGDPEGALAHENQLGFYEQGGIIPFGSYDSGGFLPQGISVAHNGTGAPEPVGAAVAGSGGTTVLQVKLDSKVIAEAVYTDLRRKAARR
jgi:hypothetical protein